MMKTITNVAKLLVLVGLTTGTVQAQTVDQLIKEVDEDNLELMIKEFTGEIPTTVNGKTVTIKNRQHANNDLATDYLVEKFESFGGNLEIEVQKFNSRGKNVLVTQTGIENPDDVYIICAHYDTVTDYCADDNASGTTAILELAKTLSQVCFNNTIIYALWDEEEIGLKGSAYYANNLSSSEKRNIKGVINLDMIAYDKYDDKNIPVHTKSVANSNQLKDDVLEIFEAHKSNYDLTPEVPRRPVEASDHASFWRAGITAIMITEGSDFNTISPYYHKSTDRFNTLSEKYFYDITRYLMAIFATKGEISRDQSGCSFSVNEYELQGVNVHPNPIDAYVTISLDTISDNTVVRVTNINGQQVLQQAITKNETRLNTQQLTTGVYFVEVTSGNKSSVTRVIKE